MLLGWHTAKGEDTRPDMAQPLLELLSFLIENNLKEMGTMKKEKT